MNEKIKELKQQAIDYAWSLRNEGDSASLDNIFQEKFAELIVAECITICTPDISGRLDGRPYETADDFDRGFIDGQDCCVELIKQHFGVDE